MRPDVEAAVGLYLSLCCPGPHRRGHGQPHTLPRSSTHACRSRNPFVDRTAEKTELDDVSLYMHSDLQGFKPSGALLGAVGEGGRSNTAAV